MIRIGALCVIFFACAYLPAQTIALTGKVTNQSGQSVAGAFVTLTSRSLTDTTKANGTYALTADVSSVRNCVSVPGSGSVSLVHGSVCLQLTNPEMVRIDLFDMRGKLRGRVAGNNTPAGIHYFSLINNPLARTIVIVRVTLGSESTHFRYIPQLGAHVTTPLQTAKQSNRPLAKVQATIDTIQASAVGYAIKKVPISSYTATVDITLESTFTGSCTPSTRYNTNVSGTGTHKVIVETNTDPGIKEGTIFRPEDLGPGKKYPIFVWGEGACALDGLGNSAAMAEIASHGYFVIADGTPKGSGSRPMNMSNLEEMGRPALAYISWIIAENRKPCSAYYQSIDTAKIGANGFSCGGLFSMGTAADPRITTWGLNSSGSFSDNPALWNKVHTPVLIVEGKTDATGAYTNGMRDFNGISPRGQPVMFISHNTFGHGGDLWSAHGGEFTKIDLAWLNWWLKGDEGATGKGVLVGAGCKYCSDSNWEVKSANLP